MVRSDVDSAKLATLIASVQQWTPSRHQLSASVPKGPHDLF